ncbi:DNA-binding protein WhiA [Orenia marismortui]|uniref:DNA-binding protein WhiA n=1 Tax=Orenia marismortui TaxID=46469 RepID=UPI0003640811|nr:DNA-binding protein WhiA [Orenia marismortui]
MSFTDDVKNEVARKEDLDSCCQLAELAALIKLDGSLEIVRHKLALKLVSQNASVARRVYKLLKEQFNFFTEIVVRKKMYLDKKNYYIIKVPPQEGVKKLLVNCGLIEEGYQINYKIKDEFMNNKCCQKAYLRGLFLAAGSISHPESEYHLEMSISYQEYAKEVIKLFNNFEIDIKFRNKQDNYLLYLKKSDDIVKVLNIIGAYSSLFQFENTRVYKGIRNNVNRLVNCETANLNKTVSAAQRQLDDIELIENLKGLDKLSPSLKEIAHLRRENPYASLKELGELLSPPLSKSGINNRLRRIKKMADKIRKSSKK